MHHSSTLWFYLTGKRQCIITILGALVILDIHQKLSANFGMNRFTQILYCIWYSYLIAKAITKSSNYVARNLEWLAIDMVYQHMFWSFTYN